MSVSFESALAQLNAMFPSFDKEVITMVLRTQNGHMERTVEALLTMQGENESAMASAAKRAGGGEARDGTLGGEQGDGRTSSGSTAKSAASGNLKSDGQEDGEGESILPEDFLRVPGGWPRPTQGSANRRASWTGLTAEQQAAKLAQEHQDRILAEALQNEMFTRQLQQ